ncbi:hypothetical protein FJZ21_02940 [Candidatus Pacearchaeota archaeon]|nr:hypothetical protein [Candidatus Pacearchaeota archaeon]
MSKKKSSTREYVNTIVSRPTIVYDPNHLQGNWYVKVEVIKDHHRQPIQGGPINFDYRSRTTYDLPINGPGLNKARRRLRSLLERLGLPEPQQPIKKYEGVIGQKKSS